MDEIRNSGVGSNPTCLKSALSYASVGIPVLPLQPNGKEPLGALVPNGFRNATTDAEKIKSWWAMYPTANFGVVTGSASNLVVIDIDVRNGQNGQDSITQAGMPLVETWAIQTPSGGFHCIYRIPDGHNISSRQGVFPLVDIKAEGGYVVAPPSVINGTQYQCVSEQEPAPLPNTWISAISSNPQQIASSTTQDIPDGQRNTTLTRLAGHLRRPGLNEEEIGAALLVANRNRCKPPLPDSDVLRVSSSVAKYEPGDPVNPGEQKYDIRRYDGTEPSPPDWQVKGLIEKGTIVEIFGGWGSGKTFLVLDLLACIATGRDYCGRAVSQGPVIYFCGEGQRGLHRRLSAWSLQTNTKLADYPFYCCTTPAALCEEGDPQEVIAAIGATNETPVHVCFDTRARNYGAGDENSPKDMGAFLAAIDAIKHRFGCTVSVIHHPGHMDKTRGRGHSAWDGALDVSYRVAQDRSGVLTVGIGKPPKDFEEPKEFSFKFKSIELGPTDEDGDPITSCVLIPTEIPLAPEKRPQGKVQKRALSILHKLEAPIYKKQFGAEQTGISIAEHTISKCEWRKACLDAGIKESSFYSAYEPLERDGYIITLGDRVRSSGSRTLRNYES